MFVAREWRAIIGTEADIQALYASCNVCNSAIAAAAHLLRLLTHDCANLAKEKLRVNTYGPTKKQESTTPIRYLSAAAQEDKQTLSLWELKNATPNGFP
eukprot:1557-Heterococcus_DN1.PRE.3